MSFDREDFLKSAAADRLKQRLAALPNLMLLEQAEVAASNLTGDPGWDLLLRVLQAAIDKTSKQADDCVRQLTNPAIAEDVDVRLIRQRLLLLNERIACWTAVMAVPKQLQTESKEAIDLVASIMPDDGK